jgi:sugar lactone lactonase YvrE
MPHPDKPFTPKSVETPLTPLDRRDFVLTMGSLALTGCGGGGGGGMAAVNSTPPVVQPAAPTVWVVQTLAGKGGISGTADGVGTSATFNVPSGLCVDRSGYVYVVDGGNCLIRKISPAGVVTTFAGTGIAGTADGYGRSASFYNPVGVVIDSQGNFFVTDTYDNNVIRKITPDGHVSTIAGQSGVSLATKDGTGLSASFSLVGDLAIDHSDNLYVVDLQWIRKITPGGVVTTLSSPAMSGSPSATASWLTFSQPEGVAVDLSGNVYVTEFGQKRIQKITPAGVISTVAGSGVNARIDGTGTSASFFAPHELEVDRSGVLYVSESSGDSPITGNKSNCIRTITPDGVVTTIAGQPDGTPGTLDGTGTRAAFSAPHYVVVDTSGNLYVSDSNSNLIRKIIHIP